MRELFRTHGAIDAFEERGIAARMAGEPKLNMGAILHHRTRDRIVPLAALRRYIGRVCAALLPALALASAFGQTADAADTLLTRPTLTGDWGGARTTLANNGVSLDLRHSSTYQGLIEGSGDKDFAYGGKVDAFINLDSARMGLWEGGGFRSHIEYRHGDANSGLGGAIFATNAMLFWPGDEPDKWAATSLHFTQKLDDRSSVAIGKFNPVDLLAADPFYGGWGIDRFMNLVFAAPPSGVVPVVFMGAIGSLRTEAINWTLMVFDPEDRTFDYLPGDLFSTGVNISLSGAHNTTLAGRKTTYAVTGVYSTAEGTDYSDLQPGIGSTSTKKGSYNVAFEFKHNLQESTTQPNAGWGFYLKAAIADGNPNYVQSSAIGGIGGRPLFFGRPQDSFGIGAFRYNISDVLQSAVNPNTTFGHESGMEAYYSHALTPWLHVTADVQYLKPATRGDENALILALRTSIRF